MKIFYGALKDLYKLRMNIETENDASYDNILNQLKSIKHTSEGTFKRWNGLINSLKLGNDNQSIELIISWVEEYINFVSNEINEFDPSWKEYKKILIEKQNIIKEILSEIAAMEKSSKTKIDGHLKFTLHHLIEAQIGFEKEL